jgi:hypothetical protein
MEISEADINRHLAATLAGKIPGMLDGWVAFDGARLDLEPNSLGRSSCVQIGQRPSSHHWKPSISPQARGKLQEPWGEARLFLPLQRC